MIQQVLGAADLTFWPEVALVIFIAVFTLMIAWTLRPGSRRNYQEIARIPLEDEGSSDV